MDALPANGDLEDAVQLAQGAVGWHQHAPPHHRADKLEPKLQLQDGAGRRGGGYTGSVRQGPASLATSAPDYVGSRPLAMTAPHTSSCSVCSGRCPSSLIASAHRQLTAGCGMMLFSCFP